MSRPANVDVIESHSGADTIPFHDQLELYKMLFCVLTILYHDIETFLNKQRSVEDNQTKAQRQNIIARANFKEGSYSSLIFQDVRISEHTPLTDSNSLRSIRNNLNEILTSPSICSWSNGLSDLSTGFARESLLALRYDDGCTKPWLSILLPADPATGIGADGAVAELATSISENGTGAMTTPR